VRVYIALWLGGAGQERGQGPRGIGQKTSPSAGLAKKRVLPGLRSTVLSSGLQAAGVASVWLGF